MAILFLDIETLGTDSEQFGIVEISAKFAEKAPFSERAMVCGAVDLGAIKYNRYHELPKVVQTETELLHKFSQYLLNNIDKSPAIICGQNVHFDFYYIKQRMKLKGIYGLESLLSYRMIDLHTLAHTAKTIGLLKTDKLNLAKVAAELNIPVEENKLHTALYDVELSESVYFKLLRLFGGKNVKNKSRQC